MSNNELFNETSSIADLYEKMASLMDRMATKSTDILDSTKLTREEQEKLKLSKQELSNLQFLENNQVEILQNKMINLRSQIELAGDRYKEFPGFIEKMNKELEQTEKKLQDLRHESSRTFKEMIQNLDQGSRQFDSIRGLFVSFIEFNKTMQNINLQMFQGGFQNLSHGYTPMMSQGFDIVSSNRQLVNEISARQTTAIVTGISTAVGAIAGMVFGPMGMMVGGATAAGLTSSVMSIFTTQSELMKAEFAKVTGTMGMFTGMWEDNKLFVDRMGTFFTSQGKNFGGNLPDRNSDVGQNYNNLNDALIENQKRFAGKEGYDRVSIGNLMTKFGTSQQFQSLGAAETMNMANQTTALSQITGMSSDAIMSIFVDLKLKLDTPTDQLVGRFMQLNRVAQEFQLPLSQVVQDLGQMRAANMRYGFSQEQLIGLYTSFNKEIKEGTVNAAKLSEYMKGIADFGTEKSVGAMALLSSIPPDELMKFYTGKDKGAAQDFLSTMSQMSVGEKALFSTMVSNPEADFSRISGATALMQKYGISQADLVRMKPVGPNMAYAVGDYYASQTGDVGIGNIIQQKMAPLEGVNIPTNLFEAGLQRKGFENVGMRGNIGLGSSIGQGDEQVQSRLSKMYETRNEQIAKDLEFLEKSLPVMREYGERLWQIRDDVEKNNLQLDPLEMHYKALIEFYPEMNKLLDDQYETIVKWLDYIRKMAPPTKDPLKKVESDETSLYLKGALLNYGHLTGNSSAFGGILKEFVNSLSDYMKGYK